MLRFHRLGHVEKRTVKENLKFTQTAANKSWVFKITSWILMEKVFGLYFRSQNLKGTYRTTFRDGNYFPSLFRDGNYFPSLFRDINYFPSLKLETKKNISSLFRDEKVFGLKIWKEHISPLLETDI